MWTLLRDGYTNKETRRFSRCVPVLTAAWIAAWFSGAVESDLLRSVFYIRPQWHRVLASSWNTLLCDRCHINQRHTPPPASPSPCSQNHSSFFAMGSQLDTQRTVFNNWIRIISKQMLLTGTGSTGKSRWQVAILGKLVKTTVAPRVDAAMPGCGARRQSGKHGLNLGSAAPRAFVIWRRSSRQVAAVVDCSPCTSSS
ncbi:unnamed protein product [Pleuronectes platessa]|uniref:Uncharacterized protein n=1 Tax=Pleuronectes platessa TaxID=8262 RepID=A0A9N7W2W6_PLEPL|nr:unnamed protein product [Pleuronectes platessa]